MLVHYDIKYAERGRILDILFSPEKLNTSCDFSELFIKAGNLTEASPEQFFAMNYLYMLRKARFLAHRYPENLLIVKYEEVVQETESTMKKIASFCGYTHSDRNLRPTDGICGWGGNSSHSGSSVTTATVSSTSIGR